MKILIAHLGSNWVNMCGGVERVTCNLANALVDRGHEVSIIYRDWCEGEPYFPLDRRVKQYNILFKDRSKVISETLPTHLRILREAPRLFSQKAAQGINAKYKGRQYGPAIGSFLDSYKPDVIISCSVPTAKYLIDDAKTDIPIIEMMHSHPENQLPLLAKQELDALSRCSVLQILLPSGIPAVEKFCPGLPVRVIGNTVIPAANFAQPGVKKDLHVISCVGALNGNKSQKLLAEAFISIANEYPDWKLELWGNDGTLYAKEMKKWIKRRGLEHRVLIHGSTHNVDEVYMRSDVFCLLSKEEGFPLVVMEAMEAGVPVIGCENCAGVNEIIQNQDTGFLVKRSIPDIADALKKLMDDPQLRQAMGRNGKRYIEKEYNPDKIWNQWEKLITDTVRNKAN